MHAIALLSCNPLWDLPTCVVLLHSAAPSQVDPKLAAALLLTHISPICSHARFAVLNRRYVMRRSNVRRRAAPEGGQEGPQVPTVSDVTTTRPTDKDQNASVSDLSADLLSHKQSNMFCLPLWQKLTMEICARQA